MVDDSAFRRFRQLDELLDLSMELAQHLRRKALTAETPRAKAMLAATLVAVARDVRLTVALERRLLCEARAGRRLRAQRAPKSGEPQDLADVTAPPDVVKH